MTPGLRFQDFQAVKAFDSDHVALRAFALDTAGDPWGYSSGLWIETDDGFELIAEEFGDDFVISGDMNAWDVNADGLLVWAQHPADLPYGTDSIFVRDPDGGTRRRLLGRGDQLDVGGGELRTIAQVGLGGNTTPLSHNQDSLSDDGLLTFRAIFTDDSSGTFVTSVVPEPSALAATAVILVPLARRRRRRQRYCRKAKKLRGGIRPRR